MSAARRVATELAFEVGPDDALDVLLGEVREAVRAMRDVNPGARLDLNVFLDGGFGGR